MNENELNFQYLEHLEFEILNSNFKLKDSVFGVGENIVERSNIYEEKVVEENKISEGLILKELPEHLSMHSCNQKKERQLSFHLD